MKRSIFAGISMLVVAIASPLSVNATSQTTPSNLAGAAIKEVEQKPVSDGVSTDAQGNHFITNLKDNAINKLSADGQLTRLVQDDRLLWADNVRFGNDIEKDLCTCDRT